MTTEGTGAEYKAHPMRHRRGSFYERLPSGAKLVARQSRWGNPFYIEMSEPNELGEKRYRIDYTPRGGKTRLIAEGLTIDESRTLAVEEYRMWLQYSPQGQEIAQAARDQLRGHLLVCYCPLDKPCHADVLCEAANREVAK